MAGTHTSKPQHPPVTGSFQAGCLIFTSSCWLKTLFLLFVYIVVGLQKAPCAMESLTAWIDKLVLEVMFKL
ncbi:hypothetical protein BDZ45DRAFT_205686 [Acephala macrosclerotiorum]|nr:hypothetical protein BDZ45DRAFT_205686 [Acephala macrosclerotiorum]